MRKQPLHQELLLSCNDIGPEDGIDPRTVSRAGSGRRVQRKTLQLCAQVAQTLNQVLCWESGDDLLAALNVECVVPAPSPGRLLVTVSASASMDVAEVLERLQRVMGRLRAEVARSIHRRRVPELSFRIVTRS